MSLKTELPNRKPLRLAGWDYSSPGWYFVTINTHESKPLFGVVVNGRMVLSEAGRVAEEEWRKSAKLRNGLVLDEFVVMPNHVHGIVHLEGHTKGVDASNPSASSPSFGKPVAGSLGVFVGAYKAAVSRALGRMGLMHQALPHQAPTWHRNYWDVIVQDAQALENIRNYIRFNPMNYHVVMNCGEPKHLGNRSLLGLPAVGFLASRGEAALHGALPLKPGEVIMSGFLSPMERAVFKAGLANRKPMIWVKPWALEEGIDAPAIRTALQEERLLIISPFEEQVDAPSVRRAAWCNQYVLAHCTHMVIGHLNLSGMLACILSEAPPDLAITYLV